MAGRGRTGGGRGRRPAVAPLAALLLAAAVAVGGCSASGGAQDSGAKSDSRADGAPQQQDGGNGSGAGTPGAGGNGATGNGTPGNGTTGSGSNGSGATAAKNPPLAPTYLVRTATLTVRTPHVEDALTRARALAAAAGGYAGDEDTEVDADGHARSSVELRVPPAAYDRLLDDLAGLGTLLDRKVSVSDVTSQVVDVDSRVKSQQASVARVRKLMDQASGLTDVVSLESELSTREAALEALEAQQASLRAQAGLATVTLRLTEPPVKAAPPKKKAVKHDGFWTSVGHALHSGWHAFYVTLRAVLVAVSTVLPFLALAVLAWAGYRLVRRWWPRDSGPAATASLRAPDGLPRHPPVPEGAPRTGAPAADPWDEPEPPVG